MKNLLFIFSLSFLILFSCSSDNDGNNIDPTSILGKWNLVSVIEANNNGDILESITVCQEAYWQYNFVNDSELIWRSTSDDPELDISECNPGFSNGTYSIDNNIITITIDFINRIETISMEIVLTDSMLILKTPDDFELPGSDELFYIAQLTFERE